MHRKTGLRQIHVPLVHHHTLEFIILEIGERLQPRVWGVTDHAALTFISLDVGLRYTIRVAEGLVNGNLFGLARRAGKPTVPDEIEYALGCRALETFSDDHLREIVRIVLVVGVTLVLHMSLVLSSWIRWAWITFVVDHLVSCTIFIMERSYIQYSAAQVFQLSVVCPALHSFDLVQSGLIV